MKQKRLTSQLIIRPQISNLYKLPLRRFVTMKILVFCTDVVHTASGARIYNQSHIDRLGGIMCFKRTGLSIAKIRQFYLYEEHMEEHAHDISQMMIDHEQDILNQIEELQNDLVHIREKVRYYAAVENAIEKNEPIPEWHQFFANEKNATENNAGKN
ncbi:MAG: MerR family transcriptional regulator [Lachnospiraceae bacterium]